MRRISRDTRSCANCAHRKWEAMFGPEYCLGYEMAADDEEMIEEANACKRYELEEEEEGHYCPSATAGDYSPSSPWNAPGMSVRDFI